MDLFGTGKYLAGIDQYLDRMDKATTILERIENIKGVSEGEKGQYVALFNSLVEAADVDMSTHIQEQQKKQAEKEKS